MKSQKKLDELFETFINNKKYVNNRRPETLRTYRHVYEFFKRQMPHVVYPSQLSTDVISEFMKLIKTRVRIVGRGDVKVGIKDSTAYTYLSKLDTFCIWLVEEGCLGKNPIGKGNKGSYPKYNDIRKISQSDLKRIYSSIAINSSNQFLLKRDNVMVSTLLFTGIRRGELAGLNVTDIDLEKRTLLVRAETSKSRESRTLPINDTLLLHLKDYLEERKKRGLKSEFLFVSNNKDEGITLHGLKHWVNKIKKNSGVNFHLHKFRHTFAGGMAKSGASEVIIQKLLGHTDFRMTQKYLRSMNVEDYRGAVSILSVEHFT